MLGSLIVFGCLLLTLIIAISLYYNRTVISFVLLTVLVIWSSLSYFLAYNYAGWPSHEHFPKSQIVSANVIEPKGSEKGHIYIWVYHLEKGEKHFWEFNPENTPRAYEIPYTEQSGKAFAKVQKQLEDGFVVIGGGENSDGGEGELTGDPAKDALVGTGGDKYLIEYDPHMPPLQSINPQQLLSK